MKGADLAPTRRDELLTVLLERIDKLDGQIEKLTEIVQKDLTSARAEVTAAQSQLTRHDAQLGKLEERMSSLEESRSQARGAMWATRIMWLLLAAGLSAGAFTFGKMQAPAPSQAPQVRQATPGVP
jgi:hypothetical protein